MSKKPSVETRLRAEQRMRTSQEEIISKLEKDVISLRRTLGSVQASLHECRKELQAWKQVATNMSIALAGKEPKP